MRLAGVEGGAAIIGELADDRLGKSADAAGAVHHPHHYPPGAVRETIEVGYIPCEHDLAAANQMDDLAQASKDT